MLSDEQPACMQKLQSIVGKTEDFNRAQATKQLIRLPTSDGIALVFFGDPEGPVRCALDIAYGLKDCPEVKLRMGIHSGLVYRMADINTNMNVAGGGINIAQRVMDCGDAGHILVSKRVADDLMQLARWAPCLHELGEAEVKQGVRAPLYNLYTEDLGNPEVPARLRPAVPRFRPKSIAKIAAVVLAVLLAAMLLAATGVFVALKARRDPAEAAAPAAPVLVALPEQSLTYSLTVQKMRQGKPDGGEIEMTGQEVFGNGWKFRFNIMPAQAGALYLLNEGPGPGGVTEYNVLFPTRRTGDAQIEALEKVQTGWNYFNDHTGVEKLWIVWSSKPILDLEAIFQEAGANQGIIASPRIKKVQNYLKSSTLAKVETDKSKKLSVMKARGEVVVNVVELSHEAY